MANKTHGKSKSPVYHSWQRMVHACFLGYTPLFARYGAKGILAPHEWRTFLGFYADMGERPVGTVLRRRDMTKSFSKENCFWGEPIYNRIIKGPIQENI